MRRILGWACDHYDFVSHGCFFMAGFAAAFFNAVPLVAALVALAAAVVGMAVYFYNQWLRDGEF